MSFELFLLCAGTFATGVSVLTAFLYVRSQKKASVNLLEEETGLSDAFTSFYSEDRSFSQRDKNRY